MNTRPAILAAILVSLFAITAALPAAAEEPAVIKEPAVAAKPAPTPQDPVARVNTTVITRGELDKALYVLSTQNRLPDTSTPEGKKQAESAALDQLIFAELMYQQGLKNPPTELEKQIDFRMAQNKGKFASAAEYEDALKGANMTEKELTEITRKDIVITSFIQQNIAPAITVSDEDVKKFYTENNEKLKEEPQVKASHILIGADSSATEEVRKKAKEKAETLLKEIKAGKDFVEVAKANSTCPSSQQGGDLGYFGKGQMVPEFEQAAFALKKGEMSEVVETQFGYHIIKVTEKKEGTAPKLEEIKEKIAAYLKNQKTQKAVFDYVTNLKKEAKIEILI